MSFNNNHININKSNYEEYFILYADNELTPEEKTSVQDFVAQNPALGVELNLLLSTILPPENVAIKGKEALFSHAIKQHINEADLLLFIDNELKEEEKATIEKKLADNPELQLQHQLLLKAKFNKEETIIYPFKQQLYRRTNKRYVTPAVFFRIAAAVIVLLFGSIVFMNTKDAPLHPSTTAVVTKQSPAPAKVNKIAANIIAAPEAAVAKKEIAPKQRVSKKFVSPPPQENIVAKQSVAIAVPNRKKNEKRKEEVAMAVAIEVPKIKDDLNAVALLKEEKKNKNILDKDVTISTSEAYNITEATKNTAPAFAASTMGESNNKTTLKMLLRKATRYIERTTNINTTTEDDELLIGAFAVKL